ncbi:Leucine-rich repeat 2 [Arabidopsis thaliana x Arabidopsis arenosa]|uniref:Leucine-rich repeat 2 n=1 Tax=Arabidopsis thaliana x Arabidopsis arenosa TaxID=1240361 RepID=A0A8T2FUB3_9BRAS|nr:Leucine-rich repeat 2 [Arabidopsis thaliana x Arabidopsis arenosa]
MEFSLSDSLSLEKSIVVVTQKVSCFFDLPVHPKASFFFHIPSFAFRFQSWNNLLALVDKLDINDAIGGPGGFPEFIDKTLALLTNSTTIKRTSLNIEFQYGESQVNTWIRSFLERGCLQLYLNAQSLYTIDTEFFTSNTLVELTITGGFSPDGLLPPGGVFFPKLKTLSLVLMTFVDSDMYELFISGCPLLEEFLLRNDEIEIPPVWNALVSSPSIKRLTIVHHFPNYREAHDGCWFRTPNLVYLDYSSYVPDWYEVDLGSLVEAGGYGDCDSVYDEEEYPDDPILGDVTNLVTGLSNIKTLHLSPDSLEVFYFCCKSMPVFHNLLTLSFESDQKRGWPVLPLLINKSPNLETLVIKGLVHQVTRRCGDACSCIPKRMKKKKKELGICCLSTCQVKVLHISGYQGTCRELKQMRHFLGNLKCLETVNVGVEMNHREDNDVDNKYFRITDALMKLPRVSSNCRIHFF